MKRFGISEILPAESCCLLPFYYFLGGSLWLADYCHGAHGNMGASKVPAFGPDGPLGMDDAGAFDQALENS